MIIIKRRKSIVAIIFILIGIICVIHTGKITTAVFSKQPSGRIIIDAGHGFPDGGAVSPTGTVESELNLKIAKKVEALLKKKGYTVIMTRTNDECLANEGESYAKRKQNDMTKRLSIISSSDADMFVSIHMNKFKDSRYNGAQVIYSENYKESQELASLIQAELHKIKENKTKRSALNSSRSIFLLKHANIPAVIVECGFLSNFVEEQLLLDDGYREKLAKAIVTGIENYYN